MLFLGDFGPGMQLLLPEYERSGRKSRGFMIGNVQTAF